MADDSRSEGAARPAAPRLSLAGTWRRLNVEQRVAAVGCVLLIVSTLGPFSFVEGAIVLTGAGVLFLLRRRAEGKLFHVPFGDGTVIAAAGAWAGLLILVRLFDRPLGQGLLALVCAAIVALAGIRERAKRPPDDLPEGAAEPGPPPSPPPDPAERATPAPGGAAPPGPPREDTAETQALPARVLPPAAPPGPRRPPPPPRGGDQPPLFDDPQP
ncbi:MAG: hypothetical protein QOE06_2024 [Thermoleophilaceae bacterium]|nr:hypothetical protein [Thermoleophilaceae bacterium]